MALLEEYRFDDSGYKPLLITKGWQAAQLNYMKEQDPENICKIDKHTKTDEVFLLMEGTAVLIMAADFHEGDSIQFETTLMLPGVIYNVPVNHWHNIAMAEDARVFICEDSNSHLEEYILRDLSEGEKEQLNQQLKQFFSK